MNRTSRVVARLREVRSFAQKAVTRVDRLRSGLRRHLEDAVAPAE